MQFSASSGTVPFWTQLFGRVVLASVPLASVPFLKQHKAVPSAASLPPRVDGLYAKPHVRVRVVGG